MSNAPGGVGSHPGACTVTVIPVEPIDALRVNGTVAAPATVGATPIATKAPTATTAARRINTAHLRVSTSPL